LGSFIKQTLVLQEMWSPVLRRPSGKKMDRLVDLHGMRLNQTLGV
jgi:hypothetical protein